MKLNDFDEPINKMQNVLLGRIEQAHASGEF